MNLDKTIKASSSFSDYKSFNRKDSEFLDQSEVRNPEKKSINVLALDIFGSVIKSLPKYLLKEGNNFIKIGQALAGVTDTVTLSIAANDIVNEFSKVTKLQETIEGLRSDILDLEKQQILNQNDEGEAKESLLLALQMREKILTECIMPDQIFAFAGSCLDLAQRGTAITKTASMISGIGLTSVFPIVNTLEMGLFATHLVHKFTGYKLDTAGRIKTKKTKELDEEKKSDQKTVESYYKKFSIDFLNDLEQRKEIPIDFALDHCDYQIEYLKQQRQEFDWFDPLEGFESKPTVADKTANKLIRELTRIKEELVKKKECAHQKSGGDFLTQNDLIMIKQRVMNIYSKYGMESSSIKERTFHEKKFKIEEDYQLNRASETLGVSKEDYIKIRGDLSYILRVPCVREEFSSYIKQKEPNHWPEIFKVDDNGLTTNGGKLVDFFVPLEWKI